MSRMHKQGGEPSQRMLRLGELVRHELSDLLSRGAVNDPVLESHLVTIPGVRMSPDLKLATAQVIPLGGIDAREVLEALDRNRRFLRGEIAQRINMKFAPDLRFKIDTTFDEGAKIDAILDSPKVKQDLVKHDQDS